MPSAASEEERPVIFEPNGGPSKDDKTALRNRDEKKEVRQGAKKPDKTTTVSAQKRKPGIANIAERSYFENNNIRVLICS